MTVPTRSAVKRPPGFQPRPAAGRFVLQEQKATDSNGTVSPAHPLATEPGS